MLKRRLHWRVTLAAKLKPLKGASRLQEAAARLSMENKTRKGAAKLTFPRTPGLRVLGVDLGLRHAAACAVWQTIDATTMSEACERGGVRAPGPDSLFLVVPSGESQSGPGTLYRRIGSDVLPDGTNHPAPWARLDRQFLIKLQGERGDVRKASEAEKEGVERLERELGRKSPARRRLRVDVLMSETVRVLRLALARNGRRAKVAFQLVTDIKLLPGDRRERLTRESRKELLLDTLSLWHSLHTDPSWEDAWAESLWKAHNLHCFDGSSIPLAPHVDWADVSERRQLRKNLRERLDPAAEELSRQENMKLHVLWAERWRQEDQRIRRALRWVRDWILPRPNKSDPKAIRHIGGLSLRRISTIRSLYQAQKAYRTRPEPDNPFKNVPFKGDRSLDNFGKSVLDAMEELRENRVKQLASRIAEAALGAGCENQDESGTKPKPHGVSKECKRPQQRIRGPRFAPCHAVVVENLKNYRPDELRTRRENRALMSWSASRIEKYLTEACELHGLAVRHVWAKYTSRQDSRTGLPGIRCRDVQVSDFILQSGTLWKRIRSAGKKKRDEPTPEQQFLLDLYGKWNDQDRIWTDRDGVRWRLASGGDAWEITKSGPQPLKGAKKIPDPVRIPQRGGDIFVPVEANISSHNGLQADLNAAANIGLRALLDPDWPGCWWFVPCNEADYKPVQARTKGSKAIDPGKPLGGFSEFSVARKKKTSKSRNAQSKGRGEDYAAVVNLWRDPCSLPLATSDGDKRWSRSEEYWKEATKRAIEALRKRAGLSEDG